MQTYRAFYIGGRSASWKDKLKLALAALVGGAILVAAVILSLGLALVLIPIGFIAYLFRRQILKAMLGRVNASMGQRPGGAAAGEAPPRQPSRGTVTIETDYTVVETEDRRRPGA